MTHRFLLGIVASSCMVLPAFAAEPAINAQMLGLTESALRYCTKVDPAAAEKLQAKVNQMLQGASEAAVNKIRRSEAYRTAYESGNAFISKVDEKNGPQVCADALAEHK
jgi:hypothetical protein